MIPQYSIDIQVQENWILHLFNSVGKILLHHWGHFRWGLFDEHGDKESPVQTSNTNPWFYSSQGTFKPNMYVQ